MRYEDIKKLTQEDIHKGNEASAARYAAMPDASDVALSFSYDLTGFVKDQVNRGMPIKLALLSIVELVDMLAKANGLDWIDPKEET